MPDRDAMIRAIEDVLAETDWIDVAAPAVLDVVRPLILTSAREALLSDDAVEAGTDAACERWDTARDVIRDEVRDALAAAWDRALERLADGNTTTEETPA